jgi:hypothetical protein
MFTFVGTRTVTAVLRVMGLSQKEQFQKYHRVKKRTGTPGAITVGVSAKIRRR